MKTSFVSLRARPAHRPSSRLLQLGLGVTAALVAGTNALPAQQSPPPAPVPAPPGPGLVNETLREREPKLNPVDVGGQFRARFESRNGMAVAGAGANAVDFNRQTPPNNYWLLRERVHLGYKPVSWLQLYSEGQASQSFNDRRRPEPEEDTFDLRQAYLGLGDAKKFPVSAKIGRQELSYGDERLVGAFDWNNLTRTFDAAKLRFENDTLWVDAFTSRVVLFDDNNPNVSNDYDTFSGVYASTRTLIPKQETQLYFLARNTGLPSPNATHGLPQTGGPAARDIYTVGTRVKSLPGKFGGWDYDAELAGQFGRFRDTGLGRNLDHLAYAAHAAGGYTFQDTVATPRVGLEYNFSSGDDNATDGDHGTFENLFPTNHKFYGYMDLFSWQNMHNVRLATSAKPVKGLTLTADWHLFWLADTHDNFYAVSGAPRRTGGYGIQSQNDSYAGSEIDVIASYAVKNHTALQAGYGHFFRGDYVKQSLSATGSKDADWVYVQAVLSF